MAQPQIHQPGMEDFMFASRVNQLQGLILVELRDQWYCAKHKKFSPRELQFFDTVVIVEDDKYTVIKDRNGNRRGHDGFLDLMKVKLFAEGKTLMDLPTYSKDIVKYSNGPFNLKMDDDGNLIAVSAIIEVDNQTN